MTQTRLGQTSWNGGLHLKISLWEKAEVPRTLVTQKLGLHSLYFPQNTLILTESRGEFSELHSLLDFVRFAIA